MNSSTEHKLRAHWEHMRKTSGLYSIPRVSLVEWRCFSFEPHSLAAVKTKRTAVYKVRTSNTDYGLRTTVHRYEESAQWSAWQSAIGTTALVLAATSGRRIKLTLILIEIEKRDHLFGCRRNHYLGVLREKRCIDVGAIKYLPIRKICS